MFRSKDVYTEKLVLVSYVLNCFQCQFHSKYICIYIGFSFRYLLPDTLYYKLDPCDTITCNGTNAQCQIYLGGENKGQPFCACPQGLTGDPNHGCGKHS